MNELDRVKLIITFLINKGVAKSRKEIGQLLGYTNESSFSQILNEKVSMPKNFINKLSSLDEGINQIWLFTGNGEMLKESSTPQKSYTAGVPYYNVDFVGGFDLVVNDQTTNPDYLIDFKEYNKADCWCNITGRSMEPEINNGDIVALKEIKDWEMFLPLGEIYAIVAKNGMRTVKKLGGGADENSYTLIPTNKSGEFGEQPLQKSAIDRVYMVLGCMKKF